MLKVNNKQAISRLSLRSLKAARLRNIMAIFAIALTSILFTTLFTLGIGTLDTFQEATMRQSGGSAHAVLKYIDDTTFDTIKNHPLIKSIGYCRMLSDSVDNPELLKRHGELWYLDDVGLDLRFSKPTTGTNPIKENEIIMDTKTIELLGIAQEIGAPVSLTLTLRGQQVTRDFVLSGWWEADSTLNVSTIVTSRAYVDAHLDELKYTYKDDYSSLGAIMADILFKNTWNMQNKLDKVITETGYSLFEDDANYLESNLNWAYLSSSMGADLGTIVGGIAAILLFTFTGYLIIYNIFQISVLRDIRYYGLLKTIGTTKKQIKRIILRQATILSLIGIPLGLIIGYIIGNKFVPLIIQTSYYAGTHAATPFNPIIFIASALFTSITVWISIRKPGKIAAKVSPVEAVRYTDVSLSYQKKAKHSTSGGKLPRIALANLGRNKKRTALVLLSLSLSLVLLNTVFTISRGLDMDKFLSKFVDTDFLFAHADYMNFRYFGSDSSVDEQSIAAIESQSCFKEGGRFYNTSTEYFTFSKKNFIPSRYTNYFEDLPLASVYGLDDLPLSRLEVLEGEIDMEKLKSGNYILTGVYLDDNNNPEWDYDTHEIGEEITLISHRLINPETSELKEESQTYTIMAKIAIKYYTNTNRRSSENFYLPSNVYLPLTTEKAIMNYVFNVKDGEEASMETFLKNYIKNTAPVMNYESKSTYANEFLGMKNLLLSVGGILSGIIGFIGILNFINSIITSIIARKKELAMLESIGMTKKQIRNMLCLEGLYYAIGTCFCSLILAILFSLLIVKGLAGGFWFFTYQFVIAPLVICLPILIIISLLIPYLAYRSNRKESMVERLREAE